MEKKNNNGVLVGILIGIIVMLLIFVCLFATGTIKLDSNNSQVTNNNQTQEDNKNIINNNNILTESEALEIIKTKFDFVTNYFNTFQNPCGDNVEIDNSIPFKNGMPWYRSKDFHTYKELNEYLLQYMTQNIISLKETYKEENYLEKDGNLYCYMLAGGNLEGYVAEKTEYVINQINDNSITATVIAAYVNPDGDKNKTVNVILTKTNNNWQISKYEEQ